MSGSIQFTFWNADGLDGVAFVAINSLAAGSVIHFRDDEFSGGTFNTGEGSFSWTVPTGGIAAGTEIRINDIATASKTISLSSGGAGGSVTAGLVALGNSAETLYAYLGADVNTPTTFLSAISNDGFTTGGLTGTGLTAGVNAVGLTGNVDVALYTGPTSFVDEAAARSTIATVTPSGGTPDAIAGGTLGNWVTQGGSGAQDADGTSPDNSFALRTFTVCFYPGTLVATPSGQRAVEDLARGDLVLTHDGQVRPIRWMGRQTVSTRFADPLRVLPIRIRAGSLDNNLPERDLLVSPDHALMLGGVLVHAAALVNGDSITRETDVPERFTYFHIELADHSLILAEGVPAETFVDNVDRMAFDNWDEHEALDDDAARIVEMELPRAKSARQVPYALRARLAERASLIMRAAQAAA